MPAKQRVHDEQVGVVHGDIGLTGNRRGHDAAVAGEQARAAAEATHGNTGLDAHPFAAPVVE